MPLGGAGGRASTQASTNLFATARLPHHFWLSSEIALMQNVQEYYHDNMSFMNIFQRNILLYYKGMASSFTLKISSPRNQTFCPRMIRPRSMHSNKFIYQLIKHVPHEWHRKTVYRTFFYLKAYNFNIKN